MFIWLASYPKSGNTLLRSMLAAYLFSKDGIYDFSLIRNIKQFPHGGLFIKMGIDIKNHNETVKNYIKAQESFNKKDAVQFIKTHSYLFNFNKENAFTDVNNTLGVIYIVRDPRNVVTSFSKYRGLTNEEMADFMITGSGDGLTWTNNWASNFHSWKLFKEHERYLLIKYEDLINKRELTFLNILNFIHKITKSKLVLDKKKFDNIIKTTSFENMQKLEKEKGFSEAGTNVRTREKVPFFNLGPKNDWRQSLDPVIIQKIEKAFKKEMEELGYL